MSANSDGWRFPVKFRLLARKCIKAFWFTTTIYHFKREKKKIRNRLIVAVFESNENTAFP